MKQNNQIKVGALLSYISIGINILAGLLYTPWMISQIGKSDYGLYTLANSLITMFLIDFGLNATTSRYVSKYVAEGKQEKANNFIGMVYKLYLIIDAVIFLALIIVYFCIDIIYVKLTPEEIAKFKVVYSIAAVYSVVNFPFVTLNGILTSYEKFIQLKLADIIQRILTVSLTVIALCNNMGLYALVTVNALSGIIVIVYKYIIVSKSTPVRVNFKFSDKALYKSIFLFSFWSTVSTLAQRLIFNITPTILGIVADSTAIAVFGVITTIEQYSYLITSAINGMFMPKISRIYAGSDESADIMPLMIKVGRFQFALNGLITVGFATVGKAFINVWMGSDFTEAYLGILLVIIPGMFFNSLQIANTAMVVKNKVKEQAWIMIAMGCLNVICSFVLSSLYGVMGACFSIFLAYSLRAVLYHIVHKTVMKLDIVYFIKKCYLRMLPSVLITLLFGMLLNSLIADVGWLILGIKAILLVFVYIMTIVVFSLTVEEKKALWRLSNKIIKK